ncbi:MAG: DNA translocase FtsK [Bacteroidales bacterium]|nr:DNA translocase FtsK [Bacteroidales bacterium]
MSYNRNKPIVTVEAEEKKIEKKAEKKTASTAKATGKKKGKAKGKKIGARKKASDPRIRIAIGAFLLLLSVFILLSTVSYLIGYKLTGDFGDMIGKYLSEYSFGIGSIYLILLLTLAGSLLTFKGPKIAITTICKYCLAFLLWMPLFLTTILPNNYITERFYGLVGEKLHSMLEPHIMNIGIIIILIFFLFLYVIFTFDIKMPTISNFKKENKGDSEIKGGVQDEIEEEEQEEEEATDEIENEEINDIEEKEEEETEDCEDDEDVEITVIRKDKKDEKEINDIESEDDDEGFETVVPTNRTNDTDDIDTDDIDMEITKPVEEKQAIEIGEHFGLDTNFDPKLELSTFKFPPLELLKEYGDGTSNVDKEELEANKKRIVDTLANYNIAIEKIKATIGPTVTLYEIIPAAGVRISKIKGLQDDIALCLSAIGIRIIAPIPGKGTVGIEVPNQKPQTVSMKCILGSERFQKCGYELPFGIGKTISNESYVADLAKMPHILMAGATGQGKSVGINAIISSLLYSKHPAELKLVLVDPKKVELSLYKKIERHYLAKLPDAEEAIITDVRKVVRTLNSLCIEMDNRYELLKDAQVRNIKEYNAKFIARKLNPYDGHRFLPYIVLVVDEFADLIMTAGKEVEAPIARLAQLARAIGIHLIIATQRPSVNIITGSIKANFPARIAFRVISRVDSMTILDTNGADQLIGRGDMLLSTGNDLVRLQCAFIDTPEVEEITDFIGSQRGYGEAYNLPDCPDEKEEGGNKEILNPNERDPLFEEAAYIIVQTQQGSTSMLQRKLKLGYNRAGRIIDQLEKAGIVGPFAGSKQREVRVANEIALEQFLKDLNMDNDNEY